MEKNKLTWNSIITVLIVFSAFACGKPHAINENLKVSLTSEDEQFLEPKEILNTLNSKAILVEGKTDPDIENSFLNSQDAFKNSIPITDDQSELISPPSTNQGEVVFLMDALAPENSYIDLRRYDSSIKNQGRFGRCTAFGIIAGMENLLTQKTHKTYDLSEMHLWNLYQEPYIEPAIAKASSTFIVPENIWPYPDSRPSFSLTNQGIAKINAYEVAPQMKSIIQGLSLGKPIYFAFDVNRSFFGAQTNGGILRAKAPLLVMRGEHPGDPDIRLAHAVVVVGVNLTPEAEGGGYLIFKNSHGKTWGDHGYGYIPLEYCKIQNCYAYTINSLDITGENNNPQPPNQPPESVNLKQFQVKTYFHARQDYEDDEYKYFFLYIQASTENLKKLAKVVYHVHPSFGRYEHIEVKSSENNFKTLTLGTYKNGWKTRGTTLYLKDGRRIELSETVVKWE
ncbi:MAG: C1 family peptidase [Deltaproteobacteria bacterium]|nr:C1 family peptidase [Deltaproteobacteria bacterium]